MAAYLRTLASLSPGIAHDLRAPINAMSFNLEVLRESVSRQESPGATAQGARLRRYVEILREELERLHERLETLFAYLRPLSDRPEVLALTRALREVETVLLPSARKRQITLLREAPATDRPLPGAAPALRQALLQVAVAVLARVEPRGTFTLGAKVSPEAILLRIRGAPATLSGAPPTEAANLTLATALLAQEGARLRRIDDSVSAEHSVAYEIEFPESRNALPVHET